MSKNLPFEEIPKGLEERIKLCYKKASDLNVELVNFEEKSLSNKKTIIYYRCNEHNQTHSIQFRNFICSLEQSPCCGSPRQFDVPTDPNQRKELLMQRCKELNIEVLNPELVNYRNYKSKVYYKCLIHNEEHGTELRRLLVEIKRPRCCENQSREKGINTTVKELLLKRNHEVIPAAPRTMKSLVTIRCKIHGFETQTTCEQYLKNSQHGLKCCYNAFRIARKAAKKGLTFKGVLAPAAPVTTNKRNDGFVWRTNKETRKFRKKVLSEAGNACFFTGLTAKQQPLEVHHLYSGKAHPPLRFDPLNGIVMVAKLHRMFHKYYGNQTPVTVQRLIDYILFLKNQQSSNSEQLIVQLDNSNDEIVIENISEKIALLQQRDIRIKGLNNL
jgi:hypothetical protein